MSKTTYISIACVTGFVIGVVVQLIWMTNDWPAWSEIVVMLVLCLSAGAVLYRMARRVVTHQ